MIRRMRTTPVSLATAVVAEVASALIVLVIGTALLVLIGVAFYNATLRASALPGFLLGLALSGLCATAFGIGASRLIPEPQAGGTVLMVIMLPLMFISNIFFPLEGSHLLAQIADFFPIRHMASALALPFRPGSQRLVAPWSDLLNLLIWSGVGCVVAVRSLRSLALRP